MCEYIRNCKQLLYLGTLAWYFCWLCKDTHLSKWN